MFLGIGLGTSEVKLLCMSDMQDMLVRAEAGRAPSVAYACSTSPLAANESGACADDALEAKRFSSPERAPRHRFLSRNQKSRVQEVPRRFPASEEAVCRRFGAMRAQQVFRGCVAVRSHGLGG